MIEITKEFGWDAAHRVLRHESKCATLHGHRYTAHITVTAPELDSVGRVIDFGVLKTLVGGWIDKNWDHTSILMSSDPLLPILQEETRKQGKRPPYVLLDEPTAENIAMELARVARRLLNGTGVTLVEIKIYETPTSSARLRVAPRPPENPELA